VVGCSLPSYRKTEGRDNQHYLRFIESSAGYPPACWREESGSFPSDKARGDSLILNRDKTIELRVRAPLTEAEVAEKLNTLLGHGMPCLYG